MQGVNAEGASTGPSGRSRAVLVGSMVALLVFSAICAGGMYFWLSRNVRDAVEVVQAQATALGRNNPAEACRHNSGALSSQMPCDSYVLWFATNAPYFPGATVRVEDTGAQPVDQGGGTVDVPVMVQGPQGGGRLVFTMVRAGNDWQVQSVRVR